MKRIFDIVIGVLVGLLIAGGLYLTVRAPEGEPVVLMPTPTPRPITVFVTGAVQRPGVYTIPSGSRVADAVNAAGGFLESAQYDQINPAELLQDGAKVNVPGDANIATPELIIGADGLAVTATPVTGEPLNINTATFDELVALPEIGETLAQRIIDYRDQNGDFTDVQDLLQIPGMTASTLEKIRPYITVGE